MKKIKIFTFLSLALFLLSCGTVKEGFINQKKNNSDEFLVEKKSPLVMPPNYNELPEPKTTKNINNDEKNEIKNLITKSEDNKNSSINSEDINKNLEKSLLEKIKNN